MPRMITLTSLIVASTLILCGCSLKAPTGTTVYDAIGGQPSADPFSTGFNLNGYPKIDPRPSRHAKDGRYEPVVIAVDTAVLEEAALKTNFEYDSSQFQGDIQHAIRTALPQYRAFEVTNSLGADYDILVRGKVLSMTSWGDWQSRDTDVAVPKDSGIPDILGTRNSKTKRDGLDMLLTLEFVWHESETTFATSAVVGRLTAESGTLENSLSVAKRSGSDKSTVVLPKLDMSRIPELLQTTAGGAIANALGQLDSAIWEATPDPTTLVFRKTIR